MGKAGKIVRLVRVMRIMRIFKLVRHFAGLQSLIYTLNQAYKELGLLMLLVGVAVLTFSSLVYFAEKDNPSGPWSFLDSFWWGLMTLTTVGYGDLSPSTFPGKLIGRHYHLEVQANPPKMEQKKTMQWEKWDYPVAFFLSSHLGLLRPLR